MFERADLLNDKNGYLQEDGSLILHRHLKFVDDIVYATSSKRFTQLCLSEELSDFSFISSSNKEIKVRCTTFTFSLIPGKFIFCGILDAKSGGSEGGPSTSYASQLACLRKVGSGSGSLQCQAALLARLRKVGSRSGSLQRWRG
ncbi:MAG: hypothetical protein GY737_14385 [Desulfobacteraceae bacterium]|nr:hypothetical protein [Desulfobacteraceae bacterium]